MLQSDSENLNILTSSTIQTETVLCNHATLICVIHFLIGFSTRETWLSVNTNYKDLNLKSQMKANKSHYKTYKRLIQARKEPAIKEGNLNIQAPDDNLLIITR